MNNGKWSVVDEGTNSTSATYSAVSHLESIDTPMSIRLRRASASATCIHLEPKRSKSYLLSEKI